MTTQALRNILSGDTVEAARLLLGHVLVRRGPGEQVRAGRIVETEAYTFDDPASHSYRGPTSRNRSMFSSPGTAYVYLIYGIHCCLNVVTAEEGRGEAVLIRAVEPIEGLEAMRAARAVSRATMLCSGPGKLCRAFSLDRSFDGTDLLAGDTLQASEQPARARLMIAAERFEPAGSIIATPRIGIRKAADLPRRFLCAESPHVSRRR
ncbi:MAG: DNA-3-methyladenine glycosylase [Spirochaetales bacterium]